MLDQKRVFDTLKKNGVTFFTGVPDSYLNGFCNYALVTVLIARDKKQVTPHAIAKMFADGIKTIAPAIGVCVIGYMIGAMFTALKVTDEMLTFMEGMNMGRFGIVVFICFITCLLGMVIPGSSLVVIFGPVFITILAAKNVNPVLAAAMLPCICGVMCGITPPLGLGMYAGMSLADSEFGKTFKNNLWWVAAQFIMEIVVLMGWLPITITLQMSGHEMYTNTKFNLEYDYDNSCYWWSRIHWLTYYYRIN